MYSGVKVLNTNEFETNTIKRIEKNYNKKLALAKEAIKHINDGETIGFVA